MLRHQVKVLQRQVKRPRLNRLDRVLFAAASTMASSPDLAQQGPRDRDATVGTSTWPPAGTLSRPWTVTVGPATGDRRVYDTVSTLVASTGVRSALAIHTVLSKTTQHDE